jgi:hypothetical protein
MSSLLDSPSVSPAVRRAWLRYLDETREAGAWEYDRVEERAWHRLASTLAALGAPPAQEREDAEV